uniref:Bromo domain-containing protein n=1 Tax=Chromera velia CCMP2878 TaxID=1169474 RepID=A0A0G4HZM5_9ALVE|eukprot:Cvel_9760.t1-p1 / transcript=Cvel_9760.t1 / gene=Cvel_9760 / organism=Chromera_velia_CCMP2878 / gene_product=PH-interacting protein, putative / transcript_product=PH-interacting protein, putative / location=Cvel_scaffold571:54584-67894(-) / protein_length=2479 / sequence_SO=supercontig / SO=protein_coding / is_pseudo=false
MEGSSLSPGGPLLPELYFFILQILKNGPCEETGKILLQELRQRDLLPQRRDLQGNSRTATSEEAQYQLQTLSFPRFIELLEGFREKRKENAMAPIFADDSETLSSLHKRLGTSSVMRQKMSRLVPLVNNSRELDMELVAKRMDRLKTIWVHRVPSDPGIPATTLCALYDRTGKTIVSAGEDKVVKLYNAQTLNLVYTIRGHQGEILDLSISLDNRFLASADKTGLVLLWRLGDTSYDPMAVIRHDRPANFIRFCKGPGADCQERLIVVTEDLALFMYDVQKLVACDGKLYTHEADVQLDFEMRRGKTCAFALATAPQDPSTGNCWMAIGGSNGRKLWLVRTLPRRQSKILEGSQGGAGYAGVCLADSGDESNQQLCAVPPTPPRASVPGPPSPFPPVPRASGVNLTLAQERFQRVRRHMSEYVEKEFEDHTGGVTDILFAQNGKDFATAAENDAVLVYWGSKKEALKDWPPPTRLKSTLFWEKETVAAAQEVDSLAPNPSKAKLRYFVEGVAWAAGDSLLAVAECLARKSDDCTPEKVAVSVFDPQTGQQIHRMEHPEFHRTRVFALVGNPVPEASHFAFTASLDGRVSVWDLKKGRLAFKKKMDGRVIPREFRDGCWNPRGTQFILGDSLGCLSVFGAGSKEAFSCTPDAQFFSNDYAPLVHDRYGQMQDQNTATAPQLIPRDQRPLCTAHGNPYPLQPPPPILTSHGPLESPEKAKRDEDGGAEGKKGKETIKMERIEEDEELDLDEKKENENPNRDPLLDRRLPIPILEPEEDHSLTATFATHTAPPGSAGFRERELYREARTALRDAAGPARAQAQQADRRLPGFAAAVRAGQFLEPPRAQQPIQAETQTQDQIPPGVIPGSPVVPVVDEENAQSNVQGANDLLGGGGQGAFLALVNAATSLDPSRGGTLRSTQILEQIGASGVLSGEAHEVGRLLRRRQVVDARFDTDGCVDPSLAWENPLDAQPGPADAPGVLALAGGAAVGGLGMGGRRERQRGGGRRRGGGQRGRRGRPPGSARAGRSRMDLAAVAAGDAQRERRYRTRDRQQSGWDAFMSAERRLDRDSEDDGSDVDPSWSAERPGRRPAAGGGDGDSAGEEEEDVLDGAELFDGDSSLFDSDEDIGGSEEEEGGTRRRTRRGAAGGRNRGGGVSNRPVPRRRRPVEDHWVVPAPARSPPTRGAAAAAAAAGLPSSSEGAVPVDVDVVAGGVSAASAEDLLPDLRTLPLIKLSGSGSGNQWSYKDEIMNTSDMRNVFKWEFRLRGMPFDEALFRECLGLPPPGPGGARGGRPSVAAAAAAAGGEEGGRSSLEKAEEEESDGESSVEVAEDMPGPFNERFDQIPPLTVIEEFKKPPEDETCAECGRGAFVNERPLKKIVSSLPDARVEAATEGLIGPFSIRKGVKPRWFHQSCLFAVAGIDVDPLNRGLWALPIHHRLDCKNSQCDRKNAHVGCWRPNCKATFCYWCSLEENRRNPAEPHMMDTLKHHYFYCSKCWASFKKERQGLTLSRLITGRAFLDADLRSWLLSDSFDPCGFVPQLGDVVRFFPDGFNRLYFNDAVPVWIPSLNRHPADCQIIAMTFELPGLLEWNNAEDDQAVEAVLSMKILAPHPDAGRVFTIHYKPSGEADYLILRSSVLKGLQRQRNLWKKGSRCKGKVDGEFWDATIIKLRSSRRWPHFPLPTPGTSAEEPTVENPTSSSSSSAAGSSSAIVPVPTVVNVDEEKEEEGGDDQDHVPSNEGWDSIKIRWQSDGTELWMCAWEVFPVPPDPPITDALPPVTENRLALTDATAAQPVNAPAPCPEAAAAVPVSVQVPAEQGGGEGSEGSRSLGGQSSQENRPPTHDLMQEPTGGNQERGGGGSILTAAEGADHPMDGSGEAKCLQVGGGQMDEAKANIKHHQLQQPQEGSALKVEAPSPSRGASLALALAVPPPSVTLPLSVEGQHEEEDLSGLVCTERIEKSREKALEEAVGWIISDTQMSKRFEDFIHPIPLPNEGQQRDHWVVNYWRTVPLPICLDLIHSRLKKGFYRREIAFRFDLDLIVWNCNLFHGINSNFKKEAAAMCALILSKADEKVAFREEQQMEAQSPIAQQMGFAPRSTLGLYDPSAPQSDSEAETGEDSPLDKRLVPLRLQNHLSSHMPHQPAAGRVVSRREGLRNRADRGVLDYRRPETLFRDGQGGSQETDRGRGPGPALRRQHLRPRAPPPGSLLEAGGPCASSSRNLFSPQEAGAGGEDSDDPYARPRPQVSRRRPRGELVLLDQQETEVDKGPFVSESAGLPGGGMLTQREALGTRGRPRGVVEVKEAQQETHQSRGYGGMGTGGVGLGGGVWGGPSEGDRMATRKRGRDYANENAAAAASASSSSLRVLQQPFGSSAAALQSSSSAFGPSAAAVSRAGAAVQAGAVAPPPEKRARRTTRNTGKQGNGSSRRFLEPPGGASASSAAAPSRPSSRPRRAASQRASEANKAIVNEFDDDDEEEEQFDSD